MENLPLGTFRGKKKCMFFFCTAVFLAFSFFILLKIPFLPCPVLNDLLIPFLFLNLLPHYGAHPSVTSLRRYTGGKFFTTLHF